MKSLLKIIKKPVSQIKPLNGRQVKNNAGGYVYCVSDEQRVLRFLILGTDGGTYYAREAQHTLQATDFLRQYVQKNAPKALELLLEVSQSGRAPKAAPLLLLLALIAKTAPEAADRQAAWQALPTVARTGTMLLNFVAFADALGGWGRLTRQGVARVYQDLPLDKLALWTIKYKSRDGWSQADALRKSHPKTADPLRNAVFKYMVDGVLEVTTELTSKPNTKPSLELLEGHLLAKEASSDTQASQLMQQYRLPIEAIPTQLRGSEVYRAALHTNGLTWLLRNLGNLSRLGVLQQSDRELVGQIVDRLSDPQSLKRGRIHPLDALKARLTYAAGRGLRGSGQWQPVAEVVEALEQAFYLSFSNVQPANTRHILGVDVSGSMTCGTVGGVMGLTPNMAATAMSMVALRREPAAHIMGFTDIFRPLGITATNNLATAMSKTQRRSFGRTDCSLPMTWAAKNKIEAETFIIYTDNDTWAGDIHPTEALDNYCQKMGIAARIIVVAFAASRFSIADPQRSDMLDVVGFDSAAPQVITAFARGEL